MNLFEDFRASSWGPWRQVLARISENTREFYAICGRGAGKSRIAALLAAWYGARRYPRAPGEQIFAGVFAPDRKQAAITLRYVEGLLHAVPALEKLILNERSESIELRHGLTLEVITASKAAPRGRSYALAVIEEASFLPTEDSAEPDIELLRAIRPALARVSGSLLVVIGTPYARRGILYDAWKRYHDKPAGNVVFVQAPTAELNPTFSAEAIARALEEDPAGARAEYLAEFRSDVEGFVAREAVEACTIPGRLELAPVLGVRYHGFVDPSGGSSDSFTLAVAHSDTDGHVVLDCLRERRPPFSPESVVAEFAQVLRAYNVSTVTGDRYAGEWPRERFRKLGIEYRPADRARSDLYLELLPMLNSGRVELVENPRLISQLLALERRTSRGGRDSIDHGPGGHDDLVNAAAGALVLAAGNAGAKGLGYLEYYRGLHEALRAENRPEAARREALEDLQGARELPAEAQWIRSLWK